MTPVKHQALGPHDVQWDFGAVPRHGKFSDDFELIGRDRSRSLQCGGRDASGLGIEVKFRTGLK